MKKYVAIGAALAALAWAGAALADTPQGKLTGSAVISYVGPLTITTTIIDGGTSYVGLENDFSGTCSGDSGVVTYGPYAGLSIVCANFVASSRDGSGPKMRFAFQDPKNANCYDIWRISEGGGSPNKLAASELCGTNMLSQAQLWVQRGASGAYYPGGWFFERVVSGGYTVTP